MKRRTDIEIIDLGSGIRRLNEYDFVSCFLIEGEDRACLIDTGAGVADMGEIVRTLTDKRLTVLITHAHADHAGGVGWFEKAYMHPLDMHAAESCAGALQRAYFLHSHKYKRKSHRVSYASVFQKDYPPTFFPTDEGDLFDLGGRTIEVYHTPGHTPGGLTLRDSLTGDLFTGDNVSPMITLQFPRAETVEVWLESAKRTLALAGDARIHAAHGNLPVQPETLQTLIGWGEELVAAGNGKNGRVCTKNGAAKYPCIVYRENRVI